MSEAHREQRDTQERRRLEDLADTAEAARKRESDARIREDRRRLELLAEVRQTLDDRLSRFFVVGAEPVGSQP